MSFDATPARPATPSDSQTNPEHAREETIVAISTPPGRGGIGIVRLSGPEAARIAQSMARLRQPLQHATARFAEIYSQPSAEELALGEQPTRLDEALVTLFEPPRSYTGELLVEIAAHGSPVVLELLVRMALRQGARLARPGEFTERAFLSHRIDLTQAEAVRDLIDAQTLYQARIAAEQMGGALSRRVQPTKQSLIALIALLEAGIDFAEDDIAVTPTAEILDAMDAILSGLTALERSFTHGRLVHRGLTLALVGRPNVGKSSLFNRLVERDRAIVTAVAGTTRDLVTERVSLGGIPVELVDTAGLRESEDEVESLGIAKSREALAEADLVLLVVDGTTALDEEELALARSLVGRRALVVCNKSDLIGLEGAQAKVSNPAIGLLTVVTSAHTGEGVAELRAALLGMMESKGAGAESGLLTNLRQHEAVSAAIAALGRGREASLRGLPHEMILLDLYEALAQLDSLTGQTTSEDILRHIFSTFCIGK